MSKPFEKIAEHKTAARTLPYTELATQPRSLLSDVLPLTLPYSLHIEPTNVCNFGCVSCPQSLDTYKKDVGYFEYMDFALFKKIIDEIRSVGRIKALKLFGYGESFLHPNIIEMIAYAKKADVADRIEITTNATRLTEDKCFEIVESGLDYLRVSIYALDQTRHEQFTKRRFKIDKIYENLRLLREIRDSRGSEKPFIYIKVMESLSELEREQFHARYADIGDELAVEILHNMSGVGGVEAKLGVAIPNRQRKRRCPLPFYQAAIGANGDMTICCIDWSFTSKVGNLRENSFIELWKSARFNEVRRKILADEINNIDSCKHCSWSWASSDNLDDLDEAGVEKLIKEYQK